MKVIDQINESGIFAQSAYSAATATKDGSGRIITDTYLTNDKESYWYSQGSGISGQMALVDDTYAIQVRVSGKNQADETASITAGIILPGASPTSAKQLATFTTGGRVAWVEAPFIATEMGLASISDVESAVSGKQDTLTFGYNSNNKINSINNSALAGEGGGGGTEYSAGDHIGITDDIISVTGVKDLVPGTNVAIEINGDSAVISCTGIPSLPESANWEATYDVVSSNSADWNSAAGMNELPVSAGQGMDIQNVDGNIVFSCTGATTFQAGPGISITEPTAGTVRIGTDETVLWEGTRTGSASFSEAAGNFEYIGISTLGGQVSYYDTSTGYKPFTFDISNDNNCWLNVGMFYLGSTAIVVSKTKAINFGAWTSTDSSISVTNNWDYGKNIIKKVVGINRIGG